MEDNDNKRDEIFSKSVRAGKRTYFFDVKSTRGNDYYLTITESKKRFGDDGKFFYEKHKLFLYKEDFDKFADGLKEVVDYIQREQPYTPQEHHHQPSNEHSKSDNGSDNSTEKEEKAPVEVEETATDDTKRFSDVSFEDLGNDGSSNHTENFGD